MNLQTAHAMFNLIRTVFNSDEGLSDGDKSLIAESLEDVYAVTKRNDMAHLIGFALEKNGVIDEASAMFSKFETEQYMSMVRQERQDSELNRICEAFECAEIAFIPLKGAVLRQLYPEPWMRTSCDIDILVDKADFERAKKCLIEVLGYLHSMESHHDEALDAPNGTHIELHFGLLEEQEIAQAVHVISMIGEHSEPMDGKRYMYQMSDEMFYFYHIAHMAKHIAYGGIGIRSFLDLYILTLDESNRENRIALLKAGGLDTLEAVVRELAVYWMCGGELSELGRRAEMFILNCGTYGSQKNSVLLDSEKKGGKGKYLLQRIFMPYEQIVYSFPILKKHKWLIPFCQIIRWVRLLSPRRAGKAAGELKAMSTQGERELNELKALLSDMGIKKSV